MDLREGAMKGGVGGRCKMEERYFKFDLAELGGALGDVGTLIPLLAALIAVNGLDPTSVFLVVGLAYLLSGLYYRLPIPIQPLKAVSAVAVSLGLSASVVSASGLWMGVILLTLSLTGLMSVLARLFPKSVVRGIQLAVGLLLVRSGLLLAAKPEVLIGGQASSVRIASLTLPLGWLLTGVTGLILVACLRARRWPASLAVLGFGFLVSVGWGSMEGLREIHLGLTLPRLAWPTVKDATSALVLLVIPQLPLTLGNAVIATADTAKDYFGEKAEKVTHKALLMTMSLPNLLASAIGGMPVCHGSGGLTAHYKFGARTGGANLMMATLCLTIALFVDGNVIPILSLIPYPVLGVLLLFVGVQHALLARDLKRSQIPIALSIAGTTLATGNLAIGFASGVLLHRAVHWTSLLIGRPLAPS